MMFLMVPGMLSLQREQMESGQWFLNSVKEEPSSDRSIKRGTMGAVLATGEYWLGASFITLFIKKKETRSRTLFYTKVFRLVCHFWSGKNRNPESRDVGRGATRECHYNSERSAWFCTSCTTTNNPDQQQQQLPSLKINREKRFKLLQNKHHKTIE